MKQIKQLINNFDNWCEHLFDTLKEEFEQHKYLIIAFIITVTALIIRFCFLDYVSGDMAYALRPWFQALDNNGGFSALKNYPNITEGVNADYPVGYINILAALTYLPFDPVHSIKVVAFIFDILLAIGAYLIVTHFKKDHLTRLLAYVIVLLMPTVILNSALWGQCDQMYVCFFVYSFYFLLKKENNKAMLVLGLAFSLKLQAIFFLPTLCFVFFNKQIKIRQCLLIFVPVFASFIPSYLAGANFIMPFDMYLVQMNRFGNANYGAANLFAFLEFPPIYNAIGNGAGIAIAFSLILIALFYLYQQRVSYNDVNLLFVITLFAFVTPFVLPFMHERYFFMADIFIVIYVLVNHRRHYLAIATSFASFLCYTHFLMGGYAFKFLDTDSVRLAALINAVTIIYLLKDIKLIDKNILIET